MARSATARKSAQKTAQNSRDSRGSILFRYRDRDSTYGVSRNTVGRMAEEFGLSETQVVHLALARLAQQTLPRYEVDDGPLTARQIKAVGKLALQGGMKVKDSLF